MVVLVALVLSFTSLKLKDRQNANIVIEKKNDILRTLGITATAEEEIVDFYAKYVVDDYGVKLNGEKVEDADAFTLLRNLKAEYDKPAEERVLPVFVGKVDGTLRYIFPLWGKGLWGPVWGYLALDGDWDTIADAVFGHKGETPGLGAEIATREFTHQFVDKRIFNGEKLVGISVLKGTGASNSNPHAVDAISGGTITSRAVQDMIVNNLGDYEVYINKERAALRGSRSGEESEAGDNQNLEQNE